MLEGMMSEVYQPPLALTVISCIFLLLGAISGLIIVGDIVWRRGWRNMMGVMVSAYPINALYMMPISLFIYLRFGRPPPVRRPEQGQTNNSSHQHDTPAEASHSPQHSARHGDGRGDCCSGKASGGDISDEPELNKEDCSPTSHGAPVQAQTEATCCVSSKEKNTKLCNTPSHASDTTNSALDEEATAQHCQHHAPAAQRPMWATVLVGVSHCGAGCVLGDLVGEWLVYGTGVSINGASIWPELLIDYAFALLFGIGFQYFSIAPMSGQWGLKTVWRAAKADILSLTSFEVGAFAWMIIYQVGIFDYKLSMLTWTYWWMMQMGMILGFATAVPMNYFLLKHGIKEACC